MHGWYIYMPINPCWYEYCLAISIKKSIMSHGHDFVIMFGDIVSNNLCIRNCVYWSMLNGNCLNWNWFFIDIASLRFISNLTWFDPNWLNQTRFNNNCIYLNWLIEIGSIGIITITIEPIRACFNRIWLHYHLYWSHLVESQSFQSECVQLKSFQSQSIHSELFQAES